MRRLILPLAAAGITACALSWDPYDPRLAPAEQGGGGADPSSGGNGDVGGAGGLGGAGGELGGGGDGGADECVGLDDGTACGVATSNACDAPDACSGERCNDNHVTDGTPCNDCGAAWCRGCDTGACAACAINDTELATAYDGTGMADGLMFNVTAAQPLRITGFSMNLQESFSGPVEVYAHPGGHEGVEEQADEWVEIHAGDVTSAGPGSPTFLSLGTSVIELEAGETIGLYVTTTTTAGAQHLYKTEGAIGGVAVDDGGLAIHYGRRLQYPFVLESATKLWNGTVHYDACD